LNEVTPEIKLLKFFSTPTEKMSYTVSAHYAAEINAQKLSQSPSQANSWH